MTLALAGHPAGPARRGPPEHARRSGTSAGRAPAAAAALDATCRSPTGASGPRRSRAPVGLRGEIRSLQREACCAPPPARARSSSAPARRSTRPPPRRSSAPGCSPSAERSSRARPRARLPRRGGGPSHVGAAAATVVPAALVIGGSGLVARATFDPRRSSARASTRGARSSPAARGREQDPRARRAVQATAENGVRSFSQLLAQGGVGQAGASSARRGAQNASSPWTCTTTRSRCARSRGSGRATSRSSSPATSARGQRGRGAARRAAPRPSSARADRRSGNHDSARLMRRSPGGNHRAHRRRAPARRRDDPGTVVEGWG